MTPPLSAVGSLLRGWRDARRMSQLDLAVAAEVSPRHVSFVETGRAVPSREMVLTLARALDVPLRDRNALLVAAGYAAAYRETGLDDPAMRDMRLALELLLAQHAPMPAVALDRRWDIVMCNAVYARLLAAVGAGEVPALTVLPAPRLNVLRLLFGAMRPLVANWESVARVLLERARREAAADRDAALREVLEACAREAPAPWPAPVPGAASPLVLTVDLALGGRTGRLFSTLTTLGTAQDITLQELRIESFHAADAQTRALFVELASGAGAQPGASSTTL